MTDQLSIDDVLARRSDPDTSKAAARGDNYGPATVRVLEALVELGDATAGEIQSHLGPTAPDRNCISRRVTSLLRRGLARDTGERRDGGRGVEVAVYAATREGREWLR